ncbi:hypothetical protein [Comamonas sp. NoAH]|uniref:hypothetical protein n=1 Tax=Comamonas halotolerans TaxID=3041496 RepID=UPI0024E07CA6|nr:hypothetical protein [Comamonas sp. NoAH]
MMLNLDQYKAAIAELQKFLDAPNPPPVGSMEAEWFSLLLDDVEAYEDALSKASLAQ